MSGGPPAFVVKQVSKSFGPVAALRDISLEIMAGERVALIGPSGAGKSTLLGILNGGIRPTSGSVTILGAELHRLGPRARRRVQCEVGTIYQQFHLVDTLRVVHNVNAGQLGRWSLLRALVSLVWPLGVAHVQAALDEVGIPDTLYQRTDHLSGGQQQRVAIARVLVQNPRVILADEPIASLDPERSREIIELLDTLCTASGRTMVASLHLVAYAQRYFDRIIGLRAGQVFFDRPAAAVTDDMLASLYQIIPGARP